MWKIFLQRGVGLAATDKSTLGMDGQKYILNILTNMQKKLIMWGDGYVKHLDISNHSTMYIYNHHFAHLEMYRITFF